MQPQAHAINLTLLIKSETNPQSVVSATKELILSHPPISEMDTITALWNANTPEAADALLQSTNAQPLRIQNFVDNDFQQLSPSATCIDSYNPRTGKPLIQVPCSSHADVHEAVDAAARAFPSWSQTSRRERSRLLQKVADLIEENKLMLALWESIDQGKTITRAIAEIERAASNFRSEFPPVAPCVR